MRKYLSIVYVCRKPQQPHWRELVEPRAVDGGFTEEEHPQGNNIILLHFHVYFKPKFNFLQNFTNRLTLENNQNIFYKLEAHTYIKTICFVKRVIAMFIPRCFIQQTSSKLYTQTIPQINIPIDFHSAAANQS